MSTAAPVSERIRKAEVIAGSAQPVRSRRRGGIIAIAPGPAYARRPTMLDWPLDWNEIREDLVIGSCPRTLDDMAVIARQARANAVLSLQEDRCRAAVGVVTQTLWPGAERLGLRLHNVPLRDFDPEHQRRHLPAAVAALRELLEGGHRVYVHCTAGINRAPLVVLGLLTFVEGADVLEALALIRRGRPSVAPYREAWEGCRADLLEAHRERAPSTEAARVRWEREVLRAACMPRPAVSLVEDPS